MNFEETKRMKEISCKINAHNVEAKNLEGEYWDIIRSHDKEWEDVTSKLTTICHFLHNPMGYYNVHLYYKWKDKSGKKRETTVGCVGPDGVELNSDLERDFKIGIKGDGFQIYKRKLASWDKFTNYMNKDNWKKTLEE